MPLPALSRLALPPFLLPPRPAACNRLPPPHPRPAALSCFVRSYELHIATVRLLDYYGGPHDITPEAYFAAKLGGRDRKKKHGMSGWKIFLAVWLPCVVLFNSIGPIVACCGLETRYPELFATTTRDPRATFAELRAQYDQVEHVGNSKAVTTVEAAAA